MGKIDLGRSGLPNQSSTRNGCEGGNLSINQPTNRKVIGLVNQPHDSGSGYHGKYMIYLDIRVFGTKLGGKHLG